MRKLNLLLGLGVLLSTLIAFGGIFHWTVNRVYISEGSSVLLRYKGPLLFGSRKTAEPGQFAKDGETGVREQMLGPGRHFYSPIWWERTYVQDLIVESSQVAIVTSKMGESLPEGEFLVSGDLSGPNRVKYKGILRKVFGPGRYRINPYAYEFKIVKTETTHVGDQLKHAGWVEIPTGYVGVVTNLASIPERQQASGIQDEVLQPGLYPVNPYEQQIDIVEIGYRETSIEVAKRKDRSGKVLLDESGEPVPDDETGISFPSNDGFEIRIDYTAIWGVMPEQAAAVVRTFGTIAAAEQKVIQPQCESICRNNGSKMGAVQLLVGETRQKFQLATSDDFREVLKDKDMVLLYGLVRHIYIPLQVRVPIQMGYIADELTLTREQEKKTAETEADLREAERKVELASEKVRVETEKLVANLVAEGEKEAKELDATTRQRVAAIDRKIAELDAQKKILLGEADGFAEGLRQVAEAQRFQLAVEAFGTASSFSKWQFAEGLPEQIDLRLVYAGEGTLWTDLKSVMPTLPLTNALKNSQGSGKATDRPASEAKSR
ncbi:MAG: band 7 protein [Planctomycetes bacterium]|nr:band 7 protein [Planctomycetota bacterium]